MGEDGTTRTYVIDGKSIDVKNSPPDFLFRFRPSDTDYFYEELERALEKKIFLTPLSKQNDPFECFPVYKRSSPKEVNQYIESVRSLHGKDSLPTGTLLRDALGDDHQARAFARRMMQKTPKRAEQFTRSAERTFDKVRTSYGIAALCEAVDSVLMWSHYTRSHTGIAVAYQFDPRPYLCGNTRFPVKMTYSDERPTISTCDLLRLGRRKHIDFASFDDEDRRAYALGAMLYVKASHWSYEQEWRIMEPETVGYASVPCMVPVAVIAGFGVDEDKISRIERVCQEVPVLKAVLSEKAFKVEVPNLDELLRRKLVDAPHYS